MPNRILREGILTSPRIAKLGWAEEVFYRRLHSVVDDFGRYFADHGLLLAACYPRQLKKVSDSDIGKWLAACEAAALVRVYPAQDGERYLQLLDFGQQIRAKKSKYPDPPSVCAAPATQTQSIQPADAHLDVSVSVSVSEDVIGAASAPPPPPAVVKGKARKTSLPDDFRVSDRVQAWASEKGYGQLSEHLDAFRRKASANGYAYADWDAAFMEAIREDWAKLRGRAPNGVAPPAEPRRHDDAAATQRMLEAKDLGTAPPPAEIREQLAALTKRLTGKDPA